MSGLPVAERAWRRSSCAAGRLMEVRSPPLKPSSWTGISSPSKIRREADAGDDDVGLFCGCDGFVAESIGRGDPGEVDAGRAGAVEVFEADGVRLRVVEVDGRVVGLAALAGHGFAALENQLAIEVEAVAFGIFACVTVVDTDAELVVAGSGRGEGAGPANGVVVALEAGDGHDLIPVEIDIAVGAGEGGLAGEVGGREVLAGEAVAGALSGPQRGLLRWGWRSLRPGWSPGRSECAPRRSASQCR